MVARFKPETGLF